MLSNPIAIVGGKFVKAKDYQGGEATCPGCGLKLTFKKYKDRRDHFAHIGKGCSEDEYRTGLESWEHKQAKDWLCKNKPDFIVPCPSGSYRNLKTSKGEWKQEVRWGKRRIDVVTDDGIFIEVVHSHVCDEEKIREFDIAGVRWIEVYASDPTLVIKQPYLWNRSPACWKQAFQSLIADESKARREMSKHCNGQWHEWLADKEANTKMGALRIIQRDHPKQFEKWVNVQPYISASFKGGKNAGTRLIDYAAKDYRSHIFVVDVMGSGEIGLQPKEWRARLENRNITNDQRYMIYYLKWESREFRELRQKVYKNG